MSAYKFIITIACSSVLLACTTVNQDTSAIADVTPACVPVAADNLLVGNWLSVTSQKGVAGAVRTLYTLNQDGTMLFVQQVKRANTPSQGIYESGCWSYADNEIVLRTYESNGLPVNPDDPIYTNAYRLIDQDGAQIHLHGSAGEIRAKRMPAGYRLPF